MKKCVYIVRPVRHVKGFTPEICETLEAAQKCAFDLEWCTCVKWIISRWSLCETY